MYRSTKRTWATAALFALGLVTLAGCGGKFAREETLPESGVSLKGTVSYGSEQVLFGLIRVKGGGREAAGKIDADGTYTVLNCPAGPVTIGVNTAAGQGDYRAAMMAGGAYKGPEGKGRGKTNVKFVDVPGKFAEPDTSGLTHTLADGENKHDIVIKK